MANGGYGTYKIAIFGSPSQIKSYVKILSRFLHPSCLADKTSKTSPFPLMCWICDSTAPICKAAIAPSVNDWFMCGVCDVTESGDDQEVAPPAQSLTESNSEPHAQADTQAERSRAEPRKRTLEPGTTAANVENRVLCDLS